MPTTSAFSAEPDAVLSAGACARNDYEKDGDECVGWVETGATAGDRMDRTDAG